MQRGLVKLSTLAVAMGLAAAAQAEVPSFKGGLNVGVEANYMQAYGVDSEFGYLATATGQPGELDIAAASLVNDTKYKFGFGVNIGYAFPGTGNDINIGYSQIKISNDSAYTTDAGIAVDHDGNLFINSLSPSDDPFNVHDNEIYDDHGLIGYTLLSAAASSSEVKQRQLDVTFGQTVNVGNNMQVRFNGGVGYAKLNVDQASVFVGNGHYLDFTSGEFVKDDANTTEMGLGYSSEFHGAGPTVGVDGTYTFGNTGLGVKAGMQASLLVGKIESASAGYIETTDTDYNEIDEDAFAYASPSESHVVPALAANLGLTYDYSVNDAYKVGVEAGYQVKNYFNAVKISHVEESAQANEVTSNLAFAGPYLKLKLAAC